MEGLFTSAHEDTSTRFFFFSLFAVILEMSPPHPHPHHGVSPFLCPLVPGPLQGQDPPGQSLWRSQGRFLGISGAALAVEPAQAHLEGPLVSPWPLPSLAPFNLLFSQAFLDLWLGSARIQHGWKAPSRGSLHSTNSGGSWWNSLEDFHRSRGWVMDFFGNLGFGSGGCV